eukprot:m.113382 g.113382  ORF g.113382 m.113382 type:complete len:63 (+) comp15356_c5_seq1:240-428(+)
MERSMRRRRGCGSSDMHPNENPITVDIDVQRIQHDVFLCLAYDAMAMKTTTLNIKLDDVSRC